MYGAKAYQLTQEEYNYLLPVLRAKLLYTSDRFYFIADSLEELADMLDRLKGYYDNYGEIAAMVVYNCSKKGSLFPFRESIA